MKSHRYVSLEFKVGRPEADLAGSETARSVWGKKGEKREGWKYA